MGLDVSHGCWSGGYMAFRAWREKLAQVAGYPPLQLMEGFFDAPFGNVLATVRGFDPTPVQESMFKNLMLSLPIKWSMLKEDPLQELLCHSDCEGEIPHELCKPLALRLQELLPLMPEGDGPGHVKNWKQTTQKFIDGLLLADSLGETVEFH